MPNAGNPEHQLKTEIYSKYEEELCGTSVCKNETNTYTVKLKKNETYYIKVYLGCYISRNCGDYKLNITDMDYINSIQAPTNLKAKFNKKNIKLTWKKQ